MKGKKICACGHEPHEGVCGYGQGSIFGACACPGTKARRGKKAKPVSVLEAFDLLRGQVAASFRIFEDFLANHVASATKKDSTVIETAEDVSRVLDRKRANGVDTFAIDPARGSDKNSGAEGSPLKTFAELNRRLGNGQAAIGKNEILTMKSALSKCERAILEVLVTRSPTFVSQLAQLSGYSRTSSGFQNALSSLRKKGLIAGKRGEPIQALEDAWLHVRPVRLADLWRLSKCELEIVEVLKHYEVKTNQELADYTESHYSHTSSGFQNALSRLRILGLVDGARGEPVRLTAEYRTHAVAR